MIDTGFTRAAIRHRVGKGRLHVLWPGVYAVGRPYVTPEGRWMAAVLACGDGAVLSHADAAALWRIRPKRGGPIHVSIPADRIRQRDGIRVHRRATLETCDVMRHDGIPVTAPVRTLIDLSTQLSPTQIERAINEADKLDLVDPEALRAALDDRRGLRGIRALRQVLDAATFTLTDSELERRLLHVVRRAGLPAPLTQQQVNGHRVDFFWPELGLVVETDGLRYHRTPTQQSTDRIRDQAHAQAGLTPLRFTHAQVTYEPRRVEEVLASVAERLRARRRRR